MSSRRQAKIAASLLTATISTVMVLPFTATADDGPGPGSDKGGKAMSAAPSGVKLTTGLSEKISVDNKTRETNDLVASVSNQGSKGSGKINLLVVGFDGMVIKDVPGCTAIGTADLPKGSNSGFTCGTADLAAGKSRTYKILATFDLTRTGKICLPVTTGDGKKTLWQQGPVPFGTTSPSPNAPVTPLLLGTENKPATPASDQGDDQGDDRKDLPSTGVGDDVLPLGTAGAALLAAGAAGLWWATRTSAERTRKS
ncbi:hypothetical protein ACIRF8_04280 [Streptomyces sp. NPDC102406]|uniref:hypothetical protein n=1 Tax=Streptomyces sp. NPDC102406 TaxID=3366171 RepID=UPI00382D2699